MEEVDPVLLAERKAWRRADQQAVHDLQVEKSEKDRNEMDKLTMASFLAESDEETAWRIGDLHVVGGNTTITAEYKTGKSTLMLNLIRSLADGVPFLGAMPVVQPSGCICYWNMELSDGMMRDWCRRMGVQNTERILIVNLRGRRQPLYDDVTRKYVIEWLQRNEVESWIVDPGVRLLPGWPGSANPENDNSCISEVTDILDVIKEESGVKDLWIPLHTGREGARRARGATRWDDWTDSRWLLYKKDLGDGVDTRMFAAHGRDVDVKDRPLHFDEPTKRYTIEGSLEEMQETADIRAAVYALLDGPLTGAAHHAAIKSVENKRKASAIDGAEQRGYIVRRVEGRKTMSYLNEGSPEVELMKIEMRGI